MAYPPAVAAPPSPLEPRAFPGARLRPTRGLRYLEALVAALVLTVSLIAAFVPDLRATMGWVGLLTVLPILPALSWLYRRVPRPGGRIEVHADGIHVEGALALPRADLERAVVTPGPHGVTVSIQHKIGLAVVIDVADEAQGHALVAALGMSATQSLSTFALDSKLAAALPGWAFVASLLMFMPAVLGPLLAGLPWLAVALGVPGYAALVAMALPARITIGLDGLLVRWLGRRELIPFGELRAIAHDGRRLVLDLAGGRRRTLSARWTADRFVKARSTEHGFASREAYLDAIVARAREAMAASRGSAAPAAAAALLRKGQDLTTWLRALRATLDRGASGFRQAETVPEQLWSTVEDGAADPTERAAAAVALGPALDDAERERLRGVARVVVSPRLRVALEATAARDEAAEAEALAALEETRAGRRAG